MTKKIVLAMSGGMDSSTLCAYYLEQEYDVFPVIFSYGSKHNKYENAAAIELCKYWNLPFKFINLESIMSQIAISNLMKTGGEIPEGHYEQENMKLTVVPGRNLIFASFLASYAESNNIDTIALGVHSGDHVIYPDCRPEFINSLNKTIQASTDGAVKIEAPFLSTDKYGILVIGYNLKRINMPYELTRTCYKDQEKSCGKCGSCSERLEAFNLINKKDPIEYE